MKLRFLILSIILLASLAVSCLPVPPITNVTTTPVVSPTTTVAKPTPTIEITPTPTPTIETTPTPTPTIEISPTPTPTPTVTITPEPTTTIPDSGTAEKKYDITHRITFTNEGPGSVSTLEV